MEVSRAQSTVIQPSVHDSERARARDSGAEAAEAGRRDARERGGAVDVRIDDARRQQVETAEAVEASARPAVADPPQDMAGRGGAGEVRGSRLDITI